MEKYTSKQRSKIVQFYFENQHSIILTQRAYRNLFNVRNVPTALTIYQLVQQDFNSKKLSRTFHELEDPVLFEMRRTLFVCERVLGKPPKPLRENVTNS